jgi:uncharacterized membrane protein
MTSQWAAPTAPAPPGVTGVVLLAAAVAAGLAAGVLGLYAHTIMPALRRVDDRTFVAAFQALDRAILNPWFLTAFFGAPALTGAAAVLAWSGGDPAMAAWLLGAFVLLLACVVITVAVNVPLNDALKAAGEPDRIADLPGARRAFDETRWVRANLVRTLAYTAAFAILVAVVWVHGRTGA